MTSPSRSMTGAAACSAPAWSTRAGTAAGTSPTSIPCAEIVARGRRITVRALNDRGLVLLPVLSGALARAGDLVPGPAGQAGGVDPRAGRAGAPRRTAAAGRPCSPRCARSSRRSRGDDPHLGLYGAFGYDLAFQFEPVRLRADRPASQRDLVLHLPDELYVLDRKREFAAVYRYEFEAGGASTVGLSRATPRAPARGDAAGTGVAAGWGPAGAGPVRAHRAAGQGAVRAG